MNLLGVRRGLDAADIGAGSGYYAVRLARRVGQRPRLCRGCCARLSRPAGRAGRARGSSPTGSRWYMASRTTRGWRPDRSIWLSSSTCTMRSSSPTACCGICARHSARGACRGHRRAKETASHGTPPDLLRCELPPSVIARPHSTSFRNTISPFSSAARRLRRPGSALSLGRAEMNPCCPASVYAREG